MYTLQVHYPGEAVPHHEERLQSATMVLTRIFELLQEHHGCEKVVVLLDATRLFAVDCKGNTIPNDSR